MKKFITLIVIALLFFPLLFFHRTPSGNSVWAAHMPLLEHETDKPSREVPKPGQVALKEYKISLIGQNPRNFGISFIDGSFSFEVVYKWLENNTCAFIKNDRRPDYLVIMKSGHFKKLLKATAGE